MTDNEHKDEINASESTSDGEKITDTAEDVSEDVTVDVEPARPLPSPKTARLSYCAFADMRPAPGSKYAPMGLFGYIAVLVATSIPVVGFIAAAIIALSSKKLACRRLALAILLIKTFILVVLGTFIIICLSLWGDIIFSVLNAILEA